MVKLISIPSQAKLESMSEDELIALIQKIDEQRIKFHESFKFLDADKCKNMITHVQKAIEIVKKNELKTEHAIKLEKVGEDYESELKQFEEFWDNKFKQFKDECEEMENKLLEKHDAELNEYSNKLNEEVPNQMKESNKLLELKDKIVKLAENQEYKDAHYMQKQYEKLRDIEFDNFNRERETKIKNMLETKIKKQEVELLALRKKIYQGFQELEMNKETEYTNLRNKYNNFKKNLETNNNMESHNFEKSMKNFCIIIRS